MKQSSKDKRPGKVQASRMPLEQMGAERERGLFAKLADYSHNRASRGPAIA